MSPSEKRSNRVRHTLVHVVVPFAHSSISFNHFLGKCSYSSLNEHKTTERTIDFPDFFSILLLLLLFDCNKFSTALHSESRLPLASILLRSLECVFMLMTSIQAYYQALSFILFIFIFIFIFIYRKFIYFEHIYRCVQNS